MTPANPSAINHTQTSNRRQHKAIGLAGQVLFVSISVSSLIKTLGRETKIKRAPQMCSAMELRVVKLEGRERHCTPGPCHFNKEQTPLASLRYQPAVSRRLFRCLGAHLLRSPLIVKSVLLFLTVPSDPRRHTTSVTSPSSSSPISGSRHSTSFRCPFASTHSFDPFVR